MDTLLRRPRTTLTLGVVLTTAALAGCSFGSDSASKSGTHASASAGSPSATKSASATPSTPVLPSAKDAWSKTQSSIRGYKQISAKGNVSVDSVRTKLSFSGDVDGDPVTMSMSAATQGSFDLRLLRGVAYLKADRSFWTKNSNATAATLLHDRWVKVPAKEFNAGKENDFAIKSELDAMASSSDPDSKRMLTSTITRDTVDGKEAYKLTSKDGQATVWTTADGKYNLLRVRTAKTETDDLTFSDWNHTRSVTAPSDAIDPAAMQKTSNPTATT